MIITTTCVLYYISTITFIEDISIVSCAAIEYIIGNSSINYVNACPTKDLPSAPSLNFTP
jgi:hypothetical protein